MFPLGELTKPEVRDIARGLGLATAEKPESQEICFVPGGDYREALRDDHIRAIQGVVVACLFEEIQPGLTRISLRSIIIM